jgi:hypothetical protein
MNLKNEEVMSVYRGMNTLTEIGEKLPSGVNQARYLNVNVLKVPFESIVDTLNNIKSNVSEREQEYSVKEISIAEVHASKDDNGNPVTSIDKKTGATSYNISNVTLYTVEKAELDKEYDDVIKEIEARNEEIKSFLAQEIEVNIHMITMEDIKNVDLHPEVFDSIVPIISDLK